MAIPPADDMVACRAFSYLDSDSYEVETRGMPYKASLVETINEAIKQKEKNPDKPNDKGKEPKPNELCEQCGISCVVHKTKTSYTIKRKRYIKYSVDFSEKSSVWFGINCECARKYREANQQTCPQCQKREFPHMKRGWMLDYEIKKAFCSPDCHVKYRNLSWEQGARLQQIEMFPPELDVEINPQQNNDWEREGQRREIFYLRESVKELQRQLAESKKKPRNQQYPNEVPHQERQISYLLNLHQNTQRRAEQAYQSRYGDLIEDNPNKGKGMSGGMIALIVVGILVVGGGLIFLLTRNKKSKK